MMVRGYDRRRNANVDAPSVHARCSQVENHSLEQHQAQAGAGLSYVWELKGRHSRRHGPHALELGAHIPTISGASMRAKTRLHLSC